MKTFTEENENQQNQNSSQDNNVVPKKVKRRSDYSNTEVKARNLLTNVAYRHFKQSDFMKDSFVIDLLSFLVQNCNPLNFIGTIVKSYIFEDGNRIHQLKYKLAEKFNLIHYIYSFLYAEIYNRTNSFGIERKSDFDFQIQMWGKEKQQKFIAKEPNNYANRKVEK